MESVIEFVGAPGAGKSTISVAVSEQLRQDTNVDERVRRLNELPGWKRQPSKVGGAVRSAGGRPLQAWSEARSILRNGHVPLPDRLRLAVNWFLVDRLTSVPEDGWIAVLDQGLLQAYWSILLGASDCEFPVLRRHLERRYRTLNAVVVIVEASEEVITERLGDRCTNPSRIGSGPETPFSVDDALSALAVLTETITALEDTTNISVVRVRTDKGKDPEQLALEVCKHL